MKKPENSEEQKYLEVVTAVGFKVLGFTFKDLRKLAKHLRTYNITLDELISSPPV